ncbi:DMT family transporter [Sphingobium aromaticiconvertens]|uniref:DMT family transporter n=1 Tax=Sphingobium aromaticiconvertens TaxID=365341 RepID=UPI003016017B
MSHSTPAASIGTPRLAFPALILGNIVLAFGPVLVRLTDVGPTAAAFWRLAIALPFLLLLARKELTQARLSAGEWGLMGLAGLFFAGDLASWHLGILHTKVANATVFGNISALLLPLWGIVVLRQTPGKWQKIAIALAAVGTLVLMGGSYETSPRYLKGDLLCLFAGFLYTFYFLLLQGARRKLGSWSVLTVATVAATLPTLAFAMALGEKIMPTDWTWVIVLALSSQLVGQGLMVYAMGWFSPLILGLSLLLQPVVAALIGWILFGETVTPTDLMGAVAIAIALILVRLPVKA